MFDLVRPCVNCPFRKGQGGLFGFSVTRLREIRSAPAFQCHKTVNYDHFDDPERRSGDRPQQCAGLMAVLTKDGKLNQIMQVAIRFGSLDLLALDPDGEAYGSWAEAVDAHGNDGVGG